MAHPIARVQETGPPCLQQAPNDIVARMVTGRIPGAFGVSEATGRVLNLRRPLGFAGTASIPLSSEPSTALSAATSAPLVKSALAVSNPRRTGSKILGASGTRAGGERTREEFRVEVEQAQIRYLVSRKGRVFFADIPDAELETIEGEYRMRNVAAQACRQLLAAARAAL